MLEISENFMDDSIKRKLYIFSVNLEFLIVIHFVTFSTFDDLKLKPLIFVKRSLEECKNNFKTIP